jgi:hypothetical protein
MFGQDRFIGVKFSRNPPLGQVGIGKSDLLLQDDGDLFVPVNVQGGI